jgi:hypothetical protein
VQKLLTDEQVDRQDFCRYSDLYSVEWGERRVSDFAGRFRPETGEDKALMTMLGYSSDEELYYVRSGNGDSFVFTRTAPERSPLSADKEAMLRVRVRMTCRKSLLSCSASTRNGLVRPCRNHGLRMSSARSRPWSSAVSFHWIVRSYRLPHWAAASSTTPLMSSLTSVLLS